MIATEDRDALSRWVARYLGRTVEVRYRPAGTRGVVLMEEQLGDESTTTMLDTCSRDARGRPAGRLRYEFRVIDVGTGRVRDTWSFSFHQSGTEDEQDETSHLDGSALGQVRQAQRFAEACFKLTIGNLQTVLTMQQATINELGDKLVAIEREKRELLLADETRKEAQHSRDAEIVRIAGDNERRAMMWDSIRLWVPIALARLNDGRAVLPGNATANELVMYELLRSMSEQQLGELLARLDDKQRTAVLTLLRAAMPVVDAKNAAGGDAKLDEQPS